MSTFAMLSLCGRLTKDPEHKFIQGKDGNEGFDSVRFSIVCDVYFRKKKENVPIYYNADAIGGIAKYMKGAKKGDLVTGIFQMAPWEDKEGGINFNITPVTVHIQSKASADGSQSSGSSNRQAPAPDVAPSSNVDFDEDDLPF